MRKPEGTPGSTSFAFALKNGMRMNTSTFALPVMSGTSIVACANLPRSRPISFTAVAVPSVIGAKVKGLVPEK